MQCAPSSQRHVFSVQASSHDHVCQLGLLRLVALVLVGGLALCGPGVDGGDLVLESRVDQAVALERVEALELGRDDERGESLTAAA